MQSLVTTVTKTRVRPPSDVEFIVVDAPVDIGLAQRARDRWGKPGTTMNLGERVGRVVSATDASNANGAAGVVGLDDYPDALDQLGAAIAFLRLPWRVRYRPSSLAVGGYWH